MENVGLWIEFHRNAFEMGLDERSLFCLVTLAINFVFFYLHGWFYVLADWYGFLDQYAIRSGKHKVATIDKQWEAIKEATLDVFIVKPVILYFIYPYVAERYIYFDSHLPSWHTCIWNWLSMKLIFSTSLYWIHRAMHHKSIYQYVHKRHHTFHDTVGFASQYAHPVEGMLSALHVIFGVILVKPHFIVFCAFMATTFFEIVDAHCGYDVPWAWLYPWSDRYIWGSGARAHDYHHSHNVGIYGGGLTGLKGDKLRETSCYECSVVAAVYNEYINILS